MARSWGQRWRRDDEPASSKRRQEASKREREARAELIRKPETPRTATQWSLAGKGRLAPCGKALLDETGARERAAKLSKPGDLWRAYRCREHACWVFGYWHLANETDARRRKSRRRRQDVQVRQRRRLHEKLPLLVWEDDGGAFHDR